MPGAGPQTAAVFAGGYTNTGPTDIFYDESNRYDGTSFSTIPFLNTATSSGAASGASTGGLTFGGGIGPGFNESNKTQIWTDEATAARAVKTIDFD
jgi:hypothetical protein